MATTNISAADYDCLPGFDCPVYYTFSGTSLLVQRDFGGAPGDAKWRIAVELGAYTVVPQPRHSSEFNTTVSTLGTSLELSRVLYRLGRAQFSVGVQEYILANVRSSTVTATRWELGATYRP
jgi:hypothetical protein